MKLLLDTNAYSDFMRGDASRVEIIRSAANILMPLIVLAELRAGFASGNQELKNAASLQKFLTSPRVGILAPDEQTTFHYAQIWTQLRHKGASIPTNDVWIASLAVQHGLPLCSSDKHFAHIPQLPLL
jgi:tRNA(fMet)-specific endonuclease VapC